MNVEIILTLVLGMAFAFGIGAGDETLATSWAAVQCDCDELRY